MDKLKALSKSAGAQASSFKEAAKAAIKEEVAEIKQNTMELRQDVKDKGLKGAMKDTVNEVRGKEGAAGGKGARKSLERK